MTTTHPKRRFFRYSLRTLMIVVTVFCVWLTIIANRARQQRQAVEAIQYGYVQYKHQIDNSDPPGPEWLRQLIGDEYFFTVESVELEGPNINDASLAAITTFKDLRVLTLIVTKVTDTGLEHLTGLTNLETLFIVQAQVTDEGVKKLQQALPNCRIIHLK